MIPVEIPDEDSPDLSDCYAADKTLTDKKRNTTKYSLPLIHHTS